MSAAKLAKAKSCIRKEGRYYFCDKTSPGRYSLKMRYKPSAKIKRMLKKLANEVRTHKGRNPYGPKMVTRYLFNVR